MSSNTKAAVIVALLFLVCTQAFGKPSFDCRRAYATGEKMTGTYEYLSDLDAKIAGVDAVAVSGMATPDTVGGESSRIIDEELLAY